MKFFDGNKGTEILKGTREHRSPLGDPGVNPDDLLSSSEKAAFVSLLEEFQLVFDTRIPGYNGAAGPIEGVVNMGPVEPPQPKSVSLSILVTNSTSFKPNLTNLSLKVRFSSTGSFKGCGGIFESNLPSEEEEWRRPLGHCLYCYGTLSQPSALTNAGLGLHPSQDCLLEYTRPVSDSSQVFYQIPLAKNSMNALWRSYTLQRCSCLRALCHGNPRFRDSPRGANVPRSGRSPAGSMCR